MDADERTLSVLMDGRVLGRVYYDRSKRVRLLYDDDYVGASGAIPLSLSMPTVVKRHGSTVLGPWLDGLLPDRSTVLDRWRREFKVTDLSSFALLRHIGRDVAGAAMFVPPGQEMRRWRPGRLCRCELAISPSGCAGCVATLQPGSP